MMLNLLYKIYAFIFGRTVFIKFNKLLYLLSLRGMGILNYGNEYLNGERDWLKSALKHTQHPVVLDVGANIGKYSREIYDSYPSAVIYAFEPHPFTYEKLKNNITEKSFHPLNLGVGIHKSELELFDYDSKDGSAHASLFKSVITEIHKSNSVSHKVNVIKLDDFLNENSIERIDLLKIDTEGNEYNVLLGVSESIKAGKIKIIHFEFNEMNIISKTTFKDFFNLLNEYDFYRIMPGGRLLKINKYSPQFCEIYAYQNIIAKLKENQ